MTHLESRLEADLEGIRAQVAHIGGMVTAALDDAVRALLTGDESTAARTILGDGPVNRAVRECDHLCHAFVIRYQPGAGHLRFASSVLRLNVALERIGDYAVTIAREAVQLHAHAVADDVLSDVELLATQATHMLTEALAAFTEGDLGRARSAMGMADQVELTFQKVYDDLLETGSRRTSSTADLFALLAVFRSLDRVADQAKNVGEETVFTLTGDTKHPKVYQVLFLDEHGTFASPLAAGWAKHILPESGDYHCAGWSPGTELDPTVAALLDEAGVDAAAFGPKPLDVSSRALAHYHVIVGLQEGARASIPDLPYHTVFVDWSDGLGEATEAATLRAALEIRLRRLMETLRGPEAT